MKPSEREREREDCGHHDVISNGSGCSTPPPLPPELQRLLYCTPTDVMCKVFSQLNCGHDDVISDGGGCSTPPPPPPALRPPTDIMCKVFSQLDCDDLLSCSLVCKTLGLDWQWYGASYHCQCYWQWYRDSSELREGWKKDYMVAAPFCRDRFLKDVAKIFFPRVKFYPRVKNKGVSRFKNQTEIE